MYFQIELYLLYNYLTEHNDFIPPQNYKTPLFKCIYCFKHSMYLIIFVGYSFRVQTNCCRQQFLLDGIWI